MGKEVTLYLDDETAEWVFDGMAEHETRSARGRRLLQLGKAAAEMMERSGRVVSDLDDTFQPVYYQHMVEKAAEHHVQKIKDSTNPRRLTDSLRS